MTVLLWTMRTLMPLATVVAWLVAISTTDPGIAFVYSLHTPMFAWWTAWWWSEYRELERAP